MLGGLSLMTFVETCYLLATLLFKSCFRQDGPQNDNGTGDGNKSYGQKVLHLSAQFCLESSLHGVQYVALVSEPNT